MLFTLFRETREGDRITLKPGDHDFAHLLLVNRGREASAAPPAAADPAVLLMSGGTTGTPKGVLGTHGAYVMAGLQVKAWNASALRGTETSRSCRCRCFTSTATSACRRCRSSSAARWRSCRTRAICGDLLADVRRVKPTFFNGVPTLYIAMLNHPLVQQGKIDFKSIRICFSGAAPLLADTKTRFESLTGARIVEGYSLTEAMMALCANPAKGPNKIGSVGMPLPDVTVRDLRWRPRRAGAAGERGRRDRDGGAAADDRLLEPAG